MIAKTMMTLALLLVAFAADAENEHDTRGIRHRVADAYGVHAFERVVQVSFAFNVDTGERQIRREWTWWPKENRIRYDGGTWRDGEPFEYSKRDLDVDSSAVMVEVDQRFVNDSYWFLFPYHVEWDLSASVTDEGMAPLPIAPASGETREARKVVVDYAGAGGYTPGDIYELYVGDDYRIQQWVFRPGGAEDKRYPITWEGSAEFGDVSFATDHRTAEGHRRLWISDISVAFENE